MNDCHYLDVQLLCRNNDITLTPAYFKSSINYSLQSVFGEIGGLCEFELSKFDKDEKRAILKVPKEALERIRIAILLIGRFQDIPCHLKVLQLSKEPIDIY